MSVGSRLLLSLAAPLAACNAIVGFDELTRVAEGPLPDGGGGRDAGGGPDGGGPRADADAPVDAGPRCNPLAPFDAPVREAVLEEGELAVRSAVLGPDELEIFFLRYHETGADVELRHGRRSDRSAPWEAVNIATEPLNPAPYSDLSITAGGLRLYYKAYGAKIYVAKRATTSEPFSSPTEYLTAESTFVFVSADDGQVYASRFVDLFDEFLVRATNLGVQAAPFQTFEYGRVASSEDEHPVLNMTGKRLYFTSKRSSQSGDVYVATRASNNAEFGPAVHVPELSSPSYENVTWASADDCEVLLDTLGHIFRARRPP